METIQESSVAEETRPLSNITSRVANSNSMTGIIPKQDSNNQLAQYDFFDCLAKCVIQPPADEFDNFSQFHLNEKLLLD